MSGELRRERIIVLTTLSRELAAAARSADRVSIDSAGSIVHGNQPRRLALAQTIGCLRPRPSRIACNPPGADLLGGTRRAIAGGPAGGIRAG
jgi:hypothetical protein